MRIVFLVILNLLLSTQSLALSTSREQALAELKGLKAQNTAKLVVLEARIKTLLTPTPQPLTNNLSVSLGINEIEIENINQQRQEHLLRQELLDRLLLQVDSKFKTGDLRVFLAERLGEMARTDLLSTTGQQNLWKQMTYLSQALRDLPERGDSIIGFVDGYLQRSNFKQPMKPEEYLRARQYTNGRDSVAAAPANRDEVGEQWESRLNDLDKTTELNPPSPSTPAN